MPRISIVPFVLIWMMTTAAGAAAQDTPQEVADQTSRFQARLALKGTSVISQPTREGMWRIRFEPRAEIGGGATFEFAYEQRIRMANGAATAGALGLLLSEAPPPYRLTPLDWEIARTDHATWRHEIDRAVIHVPLSRIQLTAGRQAIGWGRGVLFGALDLFSPFSPFEVDREWRRGVDAFRLEGRLSNRSSADMVLAFGERWADGVSAARLRGYAGDADFELVGGRRAGDAFVGAANSFVVGPAEMHLEIAAFRTPAVQGSAYFGAVRTVTKAVAGGSSRVPIAGGILVHVEYHYSGFGIAQASELPMAMTDPEFVKRLSRGDMQIVTRHALAVVANYEWSPVVSGTAALVHNPADGSGVFTPTLTLTFGDRWSVIASGYLSYGQEAGEWTLGSAYGAAPHTALVQLQFYR